MRPTHYRLWASWAAAVLTTSLVLAPAMEAQAVRYWKNSAPSPGSWSNGNNWSASAANFMDNAGAPGANETVNIRPTDAFNHIVNYDVASPLTLTQLNVDLIGATTATLSMSTSTNNLTSSNEWIGISGRGTMNQSAGTNTIAAGTGFLDVGVFAGSTGTYNLSGTGSLVANTNEYVGDVGTGFFNQSGGTNTINGLNNLYLGYNAVGTGGTYTLSGGALVANQSEYVGFAADSTFNHSGGSNTINASAVGIFSIANNNNSTSAYNLSGTGSLTVNANEYVGYEGLGFFTQSGGTHAVGTVAANRDLYLSYGNGRGNYALLGGTLTVNGSETVGYGRPGIFGQSGGTHTVSNSLSIGLTPGGQGSLYALSDGTLTVTGIENISGISSVNNSFTQTGGLHTVGDPASHTGILAVAAYTGSTASYSLTSGNLTVNGAEQVGGSGLATFTQSGGTNTIISGPNPYVGLYVGTSAGGSGTYSLSGSGLLSVTGDAFIGGSDVGPGGTGVLNLDGGTATITGTMKVWNSVDTAVNLAGATLSVGSLDIDGNPSHINWTAGALNITNSGLTIGSGGPLGTSLTIDSTKALTVSGTTTIDPLRSLTVSGGSFSTSILVNRGTFTYPNAFFNGRVLNQGTVHLGPFFTAGNGVQNDATMTIASGQTLTANGAGFDNRGTLSMIDATVVLAGTTLNNTGVIRGEGLVTAAFTNSAGGEVRVESGKWLKFQSAGGANAGRLSLLGGTLEFSQPYTNGALGQILGNGTLIVGGTGLANQGQLIFSGGVGYVFGDVNNNTGNATKGITITGNSNATFWDDVTHAAGSLFKVQIGSSVTFFGTLGGAGSITGGGNVYVEADLTPGASPAAVTYAANVYFDSTTQLKIELGGRIPSSEYDQLHVTGSLALAGTLKVDLIDLGGGLFAPAAGNSFDILDWGSVTGTFTSLSLPSLTAGLMWNASQLYTAGVLSIALAGDYNHNGKVDAADYTVWRNMLGQFGMGLAADGNGDGQITRLDFDVWKSHFGEMAGGAAAGDDSSASAAVPEPSSIFLCALGLIFAVFGSRPTIRLHSARNAH